MTNPLVTVIIAAYNEEKHIAQCLESLLQQSYCPMEIIVADDGSTDNTREVVQRLGSDIRLIALSHRGKAEAVNRAAAGAKGEILLFLDADMFFEEDYVARMVAPILAGQCLGTSHADEYVANPDNLWSACLQTKSGLPLNRRLQLSDSNITQGSVVFRAIKKDSFLRIGGFDNTGFLDDQTLYPKLKQKAQLVEGAICNHYNPETLGEVFSSGIWAGKSIALRHGYFSLVRFLPVLSILRALFTGHKLRKPAMVVFNFVYELGLFYGILKLFVGLDRSYGK